MSVWARVDSWTKWNFSLNSFALSCDTKTSYRKSARSICRLCQLQIPEHTGQIGGNGSSHPLGSSFQQGLPHEKKQLREDGKAGKAIEVGGWGYETEQWGQGLRFTLVCFEILNKDYMEVRPFSFQLLCCRLGTCELGTIGRILFFGVKFVRNAIVEIFVVPVKRFTRIRLSLHCMDEYFVFRSKWNAVSRFFHLGIKAQ